MYVLYSGCIESVHSGGFHLTTLNLNLMFFFPNTVSLSLSPPSLSRGADLKALVREAAIAALKEHMQLTPDQSDHATSLLPVATKVGGASEGDNEECVVVTMENFVSALKRVKPSVSAKVNKSVRDHLQAKINSTTLLNVRMGPCRTIVTCMSLYLKVGPCVF